MNRQETVDKIITEYALCDGIDVNNEEEFQEYYDEIFQTIDNLLDQEIRKIYTDLFN